MRDTEIKEASVESYLENLAADEETEYSLWKARRKLRRPITQIPPIRRSDGTWTRDSKQKVETFAEHLAEIFQPNNIQSDAEEVINLEDEKIQLITLREVAKEIKTNQNSQKAHCFDLITGEVLKELLKKGNFCYAHMFVYCSI